jgi:hypothetical protein
MNGGGLVIARFACIMGPSRHKMWPLVARGTEWQ